MVEDRITDGERIAQLLSSELSSRETGALDAVAVTDADPDAEPTPEGTAAYAVTVRGERVGEVSMVPSAARLDLTAGRDAAGFDVDCAVERADEDDLLSVQETTVRVPSGAAVKRALDALLAGLDDGE